MNTNAKYTITDEPTLNMVKEVFGEEYQMLFDEACEDQLDNKDNIVRMVAYCEGMSSEVSIRKSMIAKVE